MNGDATLRDIFVLNYARRTVLTFNLGTLDIFITSDTMVLTVKFIAT